MFLARHWVENKVNILMLDSPVLETKLVLVAINKTGLELCKITRMKVKMNDNITRQTLPPNLNLMDWIYTTIDH